MPYPMAAARGRSTQQVLLPSYWLTFDGTNDYIALPSSHGQEPTTGLFIEAWTRSLALDNTGRLIVCRGNSSYTEGYSLAIIPNADARLNLRLSLKTPAYITAQTFDYAAYNETLPLHVAAGYDSAAGTLYFFLQGILMKVVTGLSGTLTYTGNNWFIGKMGANLWYFKGDMTMIRVSDVCRHTVSFTPPTSFVPDANTIGLWRCQEGTGTALADASANAHNGTFLGAGEPAWGAVADLQTLSYGGEMWTAIMATVPAVTGTNIYIHRTNANTYEVYRKVHATGPYWAKWSYGRVGRVTLELDGIWTGIPDPANDVPSSWATAPATQLMDNTTEMVMSGKEGAGAEYTYGSVHGYETLDSEQWAVDGTPVALGDGDWANGSTITYTATFHWTEPDTAHKICDIVKVHTFDSALLYADREYTFTWALDWTTTATAPMPLMAEVHAANLPTCTWRVGGTDADVTVNTSGERSHAAAAWNAANGAILGMWVDFEDGLRYMLQRRPYVVGVTQKMYFCRTYAPNDALTGSTWNYHTRLIALDNCGNHFLKTT
jgi:hypothetical protein